MTPISLEGPAISREIPDSFLVVALDETGHETLDAVNHPVFGLGGLAVPASSLTQEITQPWRALKTDYFGGAHTPLHASALKPGDPGAATIGDFFRNGQFGRIAVIVSVETKADPPLAPYQLAARGVLERIGGLVTHFRSAGVALILEDATRLNPLAERYFNGYHIQLREGEGSVELPLLKFLMPKSSGEPLLEVADFIVQVAGGQVRTSLKGGEWSARRDFQAVFASAPSPLAQFLEITKAQFPPPAA
jgi:hypothetical protein